VPPERIWDAPNGVFTDQIRPPTDEEKRAARETLGIEGPAAIFIGSAFPPNIQAVEFIARRLAPALPGITFLVCGAVSETQELLSCRTDGARNLRCVGPVTEEQKRCCLWAADVGLNPMFAGSGTNVKMFDFMAAGLPVISTATGARGIDGGQANGLFVCEPWNIAQTLSRLAEDPSHSGGAAARQLVVDRHSWKKISANLGERFLTLCAEAGDGRDAVELATKHKPDIAVLDVSLPILNGIEATRQIRRTSPTTEILVFTMHDSDELISEVLHAGARGYLLKSEADDEIINAIKTLARHRPFFSSQVSEALLDKFNSAVPSQANRLTTREREIVQLIAEGNSNKKIAVLLDISVKTVETHRSAAMRKLTIRSTAELVRYAVRNKLIQA